MPVAYPERPIQQTFDKIDYAHMFQTFVSLNLLHKQCVQYTKMSIFALLSVMYLCGREIDPNRLIMH